MVALRLEQLAGEFAIVVLVGNGDARLVLVERHVLDTVIGLLLRQRLFTQ